MLVVERSGGGIGGPAEGLSNNPKAAVLAPLAALGLFDNPSAVPPSSTLAAVAQLISPNAFLALGGTVGADHDLGIHSLPGKAPLRDTHSGREAGEMHQLTRNTSEPIRMHAREFDGSGCFAHSKQNAKLPALLKL